MPQYALQRLYELTKDRDTYITTEVGQHQMWAAQYYGFEQPNRWMTRVASAPWVTACRQHSACRSPIRTRWSSTFAGDASIQMCIQEMSAAIQYELPSRSSS